LTETESALNYKDCDIKYVLVRIPESCLNKDEQHIVSQHFSVSDAICA